MIAKLLATILLWGVPSALLATEDFGDPVIVAISLIVFICCASAQFCISWEE